MNKVINMKNKKILEQNVDTPSQKIIKLIDKLEKMNKLDYQEITDANFYFPESSPTKGSTKVNLPLSYRQLSRIQ